MQKLTLLLLLTSTVLLSQQEPQFTLYDNNLSLYNSGVTGLKHKVYGAVNGRTQWAGLRGSPETFTANVELALNKNYGGVGIAYMHDEIGYSTTNKAYLNYAYHIKKETFKLGIGLGLNFGQTSLEQVFFSGVSDELFFIGLEGPFNSLAINPGAYFLHDKFEIGFGASQIGLPVSTDFNRFTRDSYYLNGAYKFDTGENLNWRISSLVITNFSATTAEIQAIATIKNKLKVGLGARNTNAFSAIAGLKIKKNFNIGYLYEVSIASQIFWYTWHTHEIFISYVIPHKEQNNDSPVSRQ